MTNRVSYLDEIVHVLKEFGGNASISEITDKIYENGSLTYIQTNPNWKDNVRATIQRHCSATRSYRGAEDIFYSVYGLGEGYWGLNSYKKSLETMEIQPIEQRQIELLNENIEFSETEREQIIVSRVGQGRFRDIIINKYHRCIVTGISDSRLLIASHIKPWRSANNYERLSSENGLLLSPLFDKLFDAGLITFKNNGMIAISNSISITDKVIINIDEERTYLHDMSYELRKNMQYHNDVIFML